MTRFSRGLIHVFPPVQKPSPSWDHNIVLTGLMDPHSEIISNLFPIPHIDKRVRKIQIKGKRDSGLHPKFLSKVVSEFHVNESTDLPVFFPKTHSTSEDAKLHTRDVVRGLS